MANTKKAKRQAVARTMGKQIDVYKQHMAYMSQFSSQIGSINFSDGRDKLSFASGESVNVPDNAANMMWLRQPYSHYQPPMTADSTLRAGRHGRMNPLSAPWFVDTATVSPANEQKDIIDGQFDVALNIQRQVWQGPWQ